jgi:hypothetical protein
MSGFYRRRQRRRSEPKTTCFGEAIFPSSPARLMMRYLVTPDIAHARSIALDAQSPYPRHAINPFKKHAMLV